LAVDGRQLAELRKVVAYGEGQHLEFKRKASFPDKIVRELIAFANTGGGTLLIGVDDDGSIPGVKFPEEELLLIEKENARVCRPALAWHADLLRISEKKYVVRLEVPKSDRRPHFLVSDTGKSAFVREKDQSIRASKEMIEVIRRLKTLKGIRFPYGEAEQKVIRFLADQPGITLIQVSRLAGLNRFTASRKIVRLVLANVLRITPTEKGDIFSRV
jgi:predicted HTH transcriptional regulator